MTVLSLDLMSRSLVLCSAQTPPTTQPERVITMNPNWFSTRRVHDGLYVTREVHFYEGNRANIWLVKGPTKDVIIDTGLGVCDLRQHLETEGLIGAVGGDRECEVICTHVHFDHSGGAHHFEKVFIHEEDLPGLQNGRQTETLNYVKPNHFYQSPYQGFSARSYKVPNTTCQPLMDGDRIDLGDGEHLEIIHLPGHTKGSIAIYNPSKEELFTGDFVYECGLGSGLLDWLPTSSVEDYVDSASKMIGWLAEKDIRTIYPGHFGITKTLIVSRLLQEYVQDRNNTCARCCGSCQQASTWAYFLLDCFRICPC